MDKRSMLIDDTYGHTFAKNWENSQRPSSEMW